MNTYFKKVQDIQSIKQFKINDGSEPQGYIISLIKSKDGINQIQNDDVVRQKDNRSLRPVHQVMDEAKLV